MKIGVIGTGYVGLVSSVCFAHVGHSLVCVDKRESVITTLQRGESPIYEERMDELLSRTIESNSAKFTISFEDLHDCEVIFLAVGTPSLPNGHADLSQVFSAIDSLLDFISQDTLIAIRSTVPIGTMKKIKEYLIKKGRWTQKIGFCPEFLREGVAIDDFLNPSYLVFASEDKESRELLQKVYQPIIDVVPEVSITHCHQFETAELIKYTINAFLATKITFMNQIAQLAQVSGADISQVIRTIGADKRISDSFLIPGPGFGGSCFPKDTIALVKSGFTFGVNMSVVEEVNHSNDRHKEYIVSWILEEMEKFMSVSGKTVAVWGLTFKADTDDVRYSSAIHIARAFFHQDIIVHAYDPKGNDNFVNEVNTDKVVMHHNPLSAVKGADVLVVLTEWEEFSKVNVDQVFSSMRGDAPLVFDTRGILPDEKYQQKGFMFNKFGI